MQNQRIYVPSSDPDADWRESAACASVDPELFFEADGELARARRSRESKARAICGYCPVRGRCLAWALAVQPRFGIWGGLNHADRIAVLAATPAVTP